MPDAVNELVILGRAAFAAWAGERNPITTKHATNAPTNARDGSLLSEKGAEFFIVCRRLRLMREGSEYRFASAESLTLIYEDDA